MTWQTGRITLRDPRFLESIPGHLAGDAASQARAPLLFERLRRLAALATSPVEKESPLHELQPHARVPERDLSIGAQRVPERVLLRSSNLVAASYDAPSETLMIEFHGGRRYRYRGVPAEIYSGLLGAWSHGRYFHQWIRNRYPYELVR